MHLSPFITRTIPALVLAAVLTAPAQADWKSWLKDTLGGSDVQTGSVSSALTSEDAIGGLKAALQNGVAYAIENLGREDGFLGNPKVRIPLPESIRPFADTLRRFGQDRIVDDFQNTLNRAAEAAVPEGKAILVDAIQGMTIDDALGIVNGEDDAATQYFRRSAGDRLHQRIMPVVSDATAKAGVTGAYKNLTAQLGPTASMLGMDIQDLDEFVTGKALDGLYLMISEEEQRIRQDPAARTTELLKKVFGR